MDNELTISYINNAIEQLIETIGIKEPVNSNILITLIRDNQVKKCINKIAFHLSLPIKIDLSYVIRNDVNYRFQTSQLSKTDSSGKGVSGITAQVLIPTNLPRYGSASLRGYLIQVKISEECNKHPEMLIAIMAHELSHVLLSSLNHPQKENEFYADLVAMILGFAHITKKGKVVIKDIRDADTGITTGTQTITCGYLSDEQFRFAFNRITSILKERQKIKKTYMEEITELKNQIQRSKETIARFLEFLKYLDHNTGCKIKHEDGIRIVSFHQTGYTDEFEKIIKESDKVLEENTALLNQLTHYTKSILSKIKQHRAHIKKIKADLDKNRVLLEDDIKTLSKHIGLLTRFKINRKIK